MDGYDPVIQGRGVDGCVRPDTSTFGHERWAAEWFARFGDEESVDANGYYLYRNWADDSDATGERESSIGAVHVEEPDTTTTWLAEFSRKSADEKAEALLMRFSDLHLHLLMLVSPELEKRVQLVYGDTDEAANRRRQEALRVVAALRG